MVNSNAGIMAWIEVDAGRIELRIVVRIRAAVSCGPAPELSKPGRALGLFAEVKSNWPNCFFIPLVAK